MANIEGKLDFCCGDCEAIHGGYDPVFANEDPDRVLPLDATARLETEGVIGRLHRTYLYTVGNATSVANSAKFGREMAGYMKEHSIDAAILTAT